MLLIPVCERCWRKNTHNFRSLFGLSVLAEALVLVEAISEPCEKVAANVNNHACIIEASNQAFYYCPCVGTFLDASFSFIYTFCGLVFGEEHFELVGVN